MSSTKSIQEKVSRLSAMGGPAELQALDLILSERLRQIEAEGFTPQHDVDERKNGQLAAAGACYLLAVHQRNIKFVQTGQMEVKPCSPLPAWPFGRVLWKPASAQRMTTKGATLALAELVRHIRAGLS